MDTQLSLPGGVDATPARTQNGLPPHQEASVDVCDKQGSHDARTMLHGPFTPPRSIRIRGPEAALPQPGHSHSLADCIQRPCPCNLKQQFCPDVHVHMLHSHGCMHTSLENAACCNLRVSQGPSTAWGKWVLLGAAGFADGHAVSGPKPPKPSSTSAPVSLCPTQVWP